MVPLIIDWIEAHPHTMDVVKWVLALLIAWITGLFRLLRRLTRKPKLEIVSSASRCFAEEMDEYAEKKHAVRAAFVLNAEVRNPTPEKIVILRFTFAYWTYRRFPFRSPELHTVSLPSRPRTELGASVKVSKVFFSYFGDEHDNLTMNGEIPSMEFQNAYLFFVSFTYGWQNPKVKNGHIKVRLTAHLTTGETLKAYAWIPVSKNRQSFDQWIPGFSNQVGHSSIWNAFVGYSGTS